jgi:hemolysin activation/secretion protein
MLKLFQKIIFYNVFLLLTMIANTSAFADGMPIPASANIDYLNVSPSPKKIDPLKLSAPKEQPNLLSAHAPAEASSIKITLNRLTVTGASVYSETELKNLYEDFLGKEITLDKIWVIASKITQLYREDGYFLSRAFVPAQEVEGGDITIRVVEGYIEKVTIDETIAENYAVKQIIRNLQKEKPIQLTTLEKEHLLLSDLPGMQNFQGILTPLKEGPEGSVHLVFSVRPDVEKNTFVGFDNFGSRYLGPYRLTGSWQGQIIQLQQTYFSAISSLPTGELGGFNISHEIPIREDLDFEFVGGYTKAQPGYIVKSRSIDSNAINAGIAMTYQMIRQRTENLSFKIGLDARNSESTVINTDLTNDKIRTLRLTTTYDFNDDWFGYNMVNMTLSKGLSVLGASDKNDLNLSRDGATSNFTKAEIELTRLQGINQNWTALLTAQAQKSSASLFSSEEFGFGGQEMGRAYDNSEISGDDGISGMIELRYQGLPEWKTTKFQPFGFLDIGKVWNQNSGQERSISASSLGAGIRFQHSNGFSGTFQGALPLTKPADTPVYGANGSNLQLTFQVGYNF